MAALFDGSTSLLSSSSPPAAAFPYTMGCWFQYAVTGTAMVLMSNSNNTSDTEYWFIGKDTADHMNLQSASGGATSFLQGTIAGGANAWAFVIARAISATNRRVAYLSPAGASEHVQQVTSRSPLAPNRQTIGVLSRLSGNVSFWNGLIGEAWGFNGDIQPDGGQLDDALLRQLAYHGPLSVPSVIPSLSFYHAMRSSLPSLRSQNEDYSVAAPMIWTNTAVSAPGRDHPSLPYEFTRPRAVARMLMI